MTIAMLRAPSSVGEKFNRAMGFLAAMPGRSRANTEYRHIGPFPKRVLGAVPRSEADLASPYTMGWQYLVRDDDGFGVLDISSRENGSYSSFRRGSFALAYNDALEAAEAEASSSQDIYELEIVEIPAAFTLMIIMKSKEVKLFPAFFQGRRLLPEARTFDELRGLAVEGRHPDGSQQSPSPF